MIYDCFTFFNEIELLKIRLEEMKHENITHVLIESNYTFSNKSKRLYFDEINFLFSEYNIKHFIQLDSPNTGNPWDNEKSQRNYISKALIELGANDEDTIIISDVDEIPKLSSIVNYNTGEVTTSLNLDTYRYYLNLLEGKQNWGMPRVLKYKNLKQSTPDAIRQSGYNNIIENAGWHFSYIGNPEKIKYKIDSFSHQELNKKEFIEKIDYKFDKGQSLFGDDFWTFVDINEELPIFLQNNKKIFSNIIKEPLKQEIKETTMSNIQKKSLGEIGKYYQTDKSSTGHNYLKYYEQFFRDIRNENIRFLEIGVWEGASLKTWNEYFENGIIIGLDIDNKEQYDGGRIMTYRGDQNNGHDLKELNSAFGPFDVILDDGSHQGSHQLFSFETLFPLLNPGGFYIIEDCLCSYFPNWNQVNILDRVRQMVGEVNMNGIIPNDKICANKDEAVKMYGGNYFEKNIEYIFVSCGTCIIKKIK